MSSTYSQELETSASDLSAPECGLSPFARSSPGLGSYWLNSGQTSQSMTTLERSPVPDLKQMELSLTESAAGSRAKTSAWQERALASLGPGADFGLNTRDSFARYDPSSSLLKTSQRSFLEDWTPYSATLPPRGMMRNGKLYQLPTSEPFIEGRGFGFALIPTPTACDHKGSGRLRLERGPNNNLRDWFKINFGFLYPPVAAVECLMGLPIGRTALKDSATPLSRKSPKPSGERS